MAIYRRNWENALTDLPVFINEFLFDYGFHKCRVRKNPFFQIVTRGLNVLVETNCTKRPISFIFNGKAINLEFKRKLSANHIIYTGFVDALEKSNTWTLSYEGRVLENEFEYRSSSAQAQVALISDNQDGTFVFQQIYDQVMKKKYKFIIHAGDIVQNPLPIYWSTHFFSIIQKYSAIPFLIAPGNHDYDGKIPKNYLVSPTWNYVDAGLGVFL